MRNITHYPLISITVAVLALSACSDSLTSVASNTPSSDPVATDGGIVAIAPVNVVTLSGADADTALRAEARRQGARGSGALAKYVTGEYAPRAYGGGVAQMHTSMGAVPTVLRDEDFGPDGPADFDLSMLQRPIIYYHDLFVAINSQYAVATATHYFANATNGQIDLTYSVTATYGSVMPEQTASFTGVGGILQQCVSDIVHRVPNPDCNVQGEVHAYVSVGLPRGCGETISARAHHTAWAVVPFPESGVMNGKKTITGWHLMHGGDANPADDGQRSASNSPCEEVETRQVNLGQSGDVGGSQIISDNERQIVTTCYANQRRIRQSDGSVGPWLTLSVECWDSFASIAAGDHGGASRGTPTRTGIAFQLVNDDATLKSRSTVLRRSASGSIINGDEIALNAATATADDLASAMSRLDALSATSRPDRDLKVVVPASQRVSLSQEKRARLESALAKARAEGSVDVIVVP